MISLRVKMSRSSYILPILVWYFWSLESLQYIGFPKQTPDGKPDKIDILCGEIDLEQKRFRCFPMKRDNFFSPSDTRAPLMDIKYETISAEKPLSRQGKRGKGLERMKKQGGRDFISPS